jgi:putative hydrolase of the HAD superfamily
VTIRNEQKGLESLKDALWSEVQYVLLDMDGTLLDKYFDEYFWGHLVPEKYADKHNITFGRAKEKLFEKYRIHEGTLNWTDIDFWSRELNLDIPALKEQIRHLIEVHPHVEEFLNLLRKRGKKIFLVTNAHYKTLKIKLRKTQLGIYFDRVVPSFDMGFPKEEILFWERAQKILRFEKGRSLFIDDTAEILKTADEFGIKYVVLKKRENSQEEDKETVRCGFLSIVNFQQLLP